MMFARDVACTIYSSETGSLDVYVSSIGDKKYEITISSCADCKLKIQSFNVLKRGFDFTSPKDKVIRPNGEIKVIVTCTGKKSIPLSASDISVYAKECH